MCSAVMKAPRTAKHGLLEFVSTEPSISEDWFGPSVEFGDSSDVPLTEHRSNALAGAALSDSPRV